MTTRAEEIAGDGPYTVGLWPDDRPNARKRYTIKGPTPCDSWWHNFEEARSRVDSLNAAYKQGQQDRWIPTAEDVKRWFQLLVGIGEEAMLEDIRKSPPNPEQR